MSADSIKEQYNGLVWDVDKFTKPNRSCKSVKGRKRQSQKNRIISKYHD